MPRGARLDTPGTLHHVILRGIERRPIVFDDLDRENFVNHLGQLSEESHTAIYAWALLDNHAHVLLRSGPAGISALMRRLLTGHAISYNRRHHRHGHLFQNRYKSIICEEDAYFTELVRSMGGWSVVKSLRRSGAQEKGDARILGSGEFVAQMIDETEQNIRRQLVGDDLMEKVQKLINDSCAKHNLSIDVLRSGSRRQAVSALRVREKINSQIDSVQAPAQQGAKTKEYPAYAVFSKRH